MTKCYFIKDVKSCYLLYKKNQYPQLKIKGQFDFCGDGGRESCMVEIASYIKRHIAKHDINISK